MAATSEAARDTAAATRHQHTGASKQLGPAAASARGGEPRRQTPRDCGTPVLEGPSWTPTGPIWDAMLSYRMSYLDREARLYRRAARALEDSRRDLSPPRHVHRARRCDCGSPCAARRAKPSPPPRMLSRRHCDSTSPRLRMTQPSPPM